MVSRHKSSRMPFQDGQRLGAHCREGDTLQLLLCLPRPAQNIAVEPPGTVARKTWEKPIVSWQLWPLVGTGDFSEIDSNRMVF